MKTINYPIKFDKNKKVVCIQGLGFVGAAMALAVANAKDSNNNNLYNVIGIDIDNKSGNNKVNSLNSGRFPFENSDKKIESVQKEVYKRGNLFATTNEKYFNLADIVIIDINLDINYDINDEPFLNLSAFKDAIKTIGKNIKNDTLVIVETTVPPGTCEKIVKPILSKELKKRGMSDNVLIAHSYERIMPGDKYFDSIVNYWRVFSATSKVAEDMCENFLKTIINTDKYPLTKLKSTTASETAKVLENSYRAMNIAFMEEWGRFAENVGIDMFEIVEAIRKRPTHSNIMQPGFGVGGYCLTKDPYFAKLASKDIFKIDGMEFPFCTEAVKVNNNMPLVTLDKIKKYFNGNIKDKKILLLGVSYRQDVGDTRHSPSEIFVRNAIKQGAKVEYQDPLVSYWSEMECDVMQEIPDADKYDVVVFAVQHKIYKNLNISKWLKNKNILILDSNNVLTEKQIDDIKNNNFKLMCIGRG
ncbi:nucleotide sugar dehydrogenase [Clostridium sp. HCP1S3_B4]|uniref:nucleotide sugar dehydrogenase n=1 Tax=unclassified Clostridium TaxID=2614128 RepID=UPI003F88D578